MSEQRRFDFDESTVDFPLWRLLDHTQYMLFRSREKELADFDLTPEQAFVLDIIHAAGGSTTITHIVDMSQRKHNSICSLVDRMARQGLLKKNRTRKDRRAFRIVSTPKGEALLERVPRKSVTAMFACLGAEEKRELADLLNRVMMGAYDSLGVQPRVHIWGN
jgi:DNA-binding MarR family transcriptional regulator